MFEKMLENMRNLTPEEQKATSRALAKMSIPTGASIEDKFVRGDAYVKLTREQRDFLLALFSNLYKEPNKTVDEIKEAIQIANLRVED